MGDEVEEATHSRNGFTLCLLLLYVLGIYECCVYGGFWVLGFGFDSWSVLTNLGGWARGWVGDGT